MIIMGLDASTKSTGYSVFKNDELIDYGLVKADNSNMMYRLQDMYVEIKTLITKYRPELIIMEDVPMTGVNLKVAKDLCVLQGLIYSLGIEKNKQILFVLPSSWRSAVGVFEGKKTREQMKREYQKERAINLVNERYNLKLEWTTKYNDDKNGFSDIAEAILIGSSSKEYIS